MRKKATELKVGDRRLGIFGAEEITHIEREDSYIKCWLDNQFVPACYDPDQMVAIAR